MKLSLKGLAISLGLMWGGAMLFTGLLHLAIPSYGGDFLRLMSSVYPGADATPGLIGVLVGVLYGLVDGVCAGLIFGWLYNKFAGRVSMEANQQ